MATKETNRGAAKRAAWSRPKLEEMGRLRDFVRVGNAFGKSLLVNDGNAEAGSESMEMGGGG